MDLGLTICLTILGVWGISQLPSILLALRGKQLHHDPPLFSASYSHNDDEEDENDEDDEDDEEEEESLPLLQGHPSSYVIVVDKKVVESCVTLEEAGSFRQSMEDNGIEATVIPVYQQQ